MLPGWGPSFIILYTPHGTSSNTIWHHNTVPRVWLRVSKLAANNTRQNIEDVTALLTQHCKLSTTNNCKTLTHRFPSKTLPYHKNQKQLCSSSTIRNAPSIAFVSDYNRHYISGINGSTEIHTTMAAWPKCLHRGNVGKKKRRNVWHCEDMVQWNNANTLKVLVNPKASNWNLSFKILFLSALKDWIRN